MDIQSSFAVQGAYSRLPGLATMRPGVGSLLQTRTIGLLAFFTRDISLLMQTCALCVEQLCKSLQVSLFEWELLDTQSTALGEEPNRSVQRKWASLKL